MNAAFGKYLAALLLFGSNGVVASMILLSSYDIVLLRTCIGSLLLLILFFITGQRLDFFKNKRSALFLAASGACMGASWMFLYEAYQQIGVSLSSLLYYCGPVLVMIVSPFLFQKKLTAAKYPAFSSSFWDSSLSTDRPPSREPRRLVCSAGQCPRFSMRSCSS